MRHLKTTFAVIGAAVILVLAGNTISLAATGQGFILGQGNSASTTTSLARTTAGPVLRITNKSTGGAPFAVNGHGKVTHLNADLLDGLDSTNFVRAGGRGAALGYAHILSGGTFDASRSWNVVASNVTTPATGFHCFRGLSFTPRSASLTQDYNGVNNGQIPNLSLRLPAVAGDCGGTPAQAEIFTGLVTPGSFTAGTNFGYYVVFY